MEKHSAMAQCNAHAQHSAEQTFNSVGLESLPNIIDLDPAQVPGKAEKVYQTKLTWNLEMREAHPSAAGALTYLSLSLSSDS